MPTGCRHIQHVDPARARSSQKCLVELAQPGAEALSPAQAEAFLRSVAPELFGGPGPGRPTPVVDRGATMPERSAPPLRRRHAQAERDEILAVLADCGGDRAKASERLGISRTTLWRKLKALDAQG